jgi:hypothetical protein
MLGVSHVTFGGVSRYAYVSTTSHRHRSWLGWPTAKPPTSPIRGSPAAMSACAKGSADLGGELADHVGDGRGHLGVLARVFAVQ